MTFQSSQHTRKPESKADNHRLATIMFSDISGYTAMMGQDEAHTLRVVQKNIQLHKEALSKYHGEIVKELGDGLLILFETPSMAVKCAKELIRDTQKEEGLELHIGIHIGEVVVSENDVLGAGVNIASRIEGEALSGQILISEAVWDNIKNKKEFKATYAGSKNLKNVGHSVRLYHVHVEDEAKSRRLQLFLDRERRNIVFSGLFIILVTIISLLYLGQIPLIEDLYGKQKIAILPFKNETNDAGLGFLSESLAEDLIDNFMSSNKISVLSSRASFKLGNEGHPIDEIAKRLNADLILSGDYEMDNGRLKLTVELTESKSKQIVNFSTYELNLKNIKEVQRKLKNDLSRSLNMSETIDPSAEDRQINLDAYRYNALGKSFLRDNRNISSDSIISYFKKALELEPSYIDAYLGIAQTYLYEGFMVMRPYSELASKIRPLLLKVQSLDRSHPILLGYQGILDITEFKYPIGEEKLRRAIEQFPNHETFYHWLGMLLYIKGDFEESKNMFDEAIMLDPENTFFLYFKGLTYVYMGELELADELYSDLLNTNAEKSQVKWFMAMLKLEQNKPKEAIEILESRQVRGASPLKNPLLGYAYGVAGDIESAKSVLEFLLNKSKEKYVSPGMIAMVYAGLKEEQKVIEMSQQASLIGDPWMSNWGRYSCIFEDYHDNPEYQAAIRHVTYQ